MNNYQMMELSSSFKGQSAAAKHTRSKRSKHGCMLPYEYMKKSEVKKLNGDVIKIQMYNPNYTYKEVRKLSRNTQKEYLESLVEHGLTLSGLAEHWGISRETARKFMFSRGVAPHDGRTVPSSIFREYVRQFNEKQNEEGTKDPSQVDKNYFSAAPIESSRAVLLSGKYELEGSAAQICETLYSLFRGNNKLHFSVEFKIIEEVTD